MLLLAALPLRGDEAALPRPASAVFDGAGVLSKQEVAELETRLERLRKSGLVEGLLYLAPSLPEGAVLEDLTLQAVNEWGIGDAETNNGLAIFAFMKERKVRIEIGLGLESRISDDAAAAIIREQIAPAFREGQYAKGLAAAMDKVETLLRAPLPPSGRKSDGHNDRPPEQFRTDHTHSVVNL